GPPLEPKAEAGESRPKQKVYGWIGGPHPVRGDQVLLRFGKESQQSFRGRSERPDDFVPRSQLLDTGRDGADFAADAKLSDQTDPRYFLQRLLNEKIRHARFWRQPAIPRTGQKPESIARPGPATHD